MKKKVLFGILGSATLALSLFLSGCFTNPVTGRKGLSLVDASTMNSLAADQYKTFLSENKPQNNTPEGKLVQKVGGRIASAVAKYLTDNNKAHLIKEYNWQFNYVQSKEVNAWCMPGGRVVVYSGIMPIAQDEAGLAVIMGHEVAHAVAHHGSERMSQGLVQQLGGVALSVAIADKPQQTQAIFNQAYGLGSTVGGILPFSRKHESEADEMGLIFMAMAGYDPAAAVGFWERMAAKSGGVAPPEFLSTHPSNTTRIKQLKELIPKAQKYYRPYNK